MRITVRLFILLFLPIVIAGCNRYTVDDFEKNRLRPQDFFDFNTTSTVELDLDFGPEGAFSYISVFPFNPVSYDTLTRIETKTQEEPLLTFFTSREGKINTALQIPTDKDSLYFYSDGLCIPHVMGLEIKDGKVMFEKTHTDYSVPETKAVSKPRLLDLGNNYYQIVDVSTAFGKPKDINGLISNGSVDVKSIQYAFWNGQKSKPSNLDNSKYAIRETRQINTSIAARYRDNSGKLVNVTDAEVFLTFVTESGSNQNVLGYYYYPTGRQPSDPSSLKKYIVLPNASVGNNSPYYIYPYASYDAPVETNTKIQLLYVDDQGKVSTKFPPGITIGYFIISDGYKVERHIIPLYFSGSIKFSEPKYYSDKEWNTSNRFISLSTGNDLIYGVEDATDKSFEDILFTISASPAGAILDDEHASVVPTAEDSIEVFSTRVQTYCFEDLWPSRGDYDMNDVVIEHTSKIGLDENNNVIKVTDVFVPCNRYKSAGVPDAFAVVIPKNQRGKMTIPDNAVLEDETDAIILMKEVQENLNKEFVITRLFESYRPRFDDLVTDLDPFIIPTIDEIGFTDKNRREVHMPKKEGTKKINAALLGMGEEAYFIDKDGKHPFAITIPVSVRNGEFIQPQEMYSVEDEYPRYLKWVESEGKQNKDWYKYYRK